MRRREFGALAVGGIVATTTGIVAMSEPATGQVTMDNLTVPNVTEDTSEPISKARLEVNGEYDYTTSQPPDTVIIRLEAKQAEWTQIDAKKVESGLEADYNDTYTLKGNLLDSDLTAYELTPANVGDSKSVTMEARVTVTVRKDGTDLETMQVTDSFTIGVEKTLQQVNLSVSGSGTVTVT